MTRSYFGKTKEELQNWLSDVFDEVDLKFEHEDDGDNTLTSNGWEQAAEFLSVEIDKSRKRLQELTQARLLAQAWSSPCGVGVGTQQVTKTTGTLRNNKDFKTMLKDLANFEAE